MPQTPVPDTSAKDDSKKVQSVADTSKPLDQAHPTQDALVAVADDAYPFVFLWFAERCGGPLRAALATAFLLLLPLAWVFYLDPSTELGPPTFFLTIIPYTVGVGAYVVAQVAHLARELAERRSIRANPLDLHRALTHVSPRVVWRLLAVAVVVALLHDYSVSSATYDLIHDRPVDPATYVLSAFALMLWVCMFIAVSILVRNALLLTRMGRHQVDVDLLREDQLTLFGRAAILPVLFLMGAEIAYPALWIDRTDAVPLAVFLPGIFLGLGGGAMAALLPLLGLRANIRAHKTQALSVIDAALGARDLTRLAADQHELRRVSDLLQLKRAVRSVREWPFDLPVLARLGFYLILAPLTWVAAALVEQVVDAVF